MFYHLLRHKRCLPPGTYGRTSFLVALLLAGNVLAQNTTCTEDSVLQHTAEKHSFTLLMALGGALGDYDNITLQRDDPPTPLRMGSSAYILCGELGFGYRSLFVSYYGEVLGASFSTYVDPDGFNHLAERVCHGPRVSCRLSRWSFDLVPEISYVFVSEKAVIADTRKERPEQYREESSDQNYSYGLSGQSRLIAGRKLQLWLYGRYVHDNLDIRADNYWMGLQLLGLVNAVSGPGRFPPMQNFRFGLYFRWTKRSDGRSDRFLVLSLMGEYGLF